MTAVAEFTLPADLEAHEPAEARGLPRDGVRMMVSRQHVAGSAGRAITHHRFTDLPGLLRPGDLLVVNNSRTLPAAVPAGPDLRIPFTTARPDGSWLVEPRIPAGKSSVPSLDEPPPEVIALPGGATLTLADPATPRLWHARLSTAVVPYLLRHGEPIRYSYAGHRWPIEAYQTVFGRLPGSAEMPSAARPFTPAVVTDLVARGVTFAPITLHCGVSSLEAGEDPYPEQYDVPPATARLVNLARRSGGRVIAVGTTVVRALETAAMETVPIAAQVKLDLPRGHPGDGPAGGGRAAHRAARAAFLAPADAGRLPRREPAPRLLRGRPVTRLPLARVRRRPPAPALAGWASSGRMRPLPCAQWIF